MIKNITLLIFISIFNIVTGQNILIPNSLNPTSIEVGQRFPVEKIKTHIGFLENELIDEPLLLVYVSSFYGSRSYLDMLSLAFDNYFSKGYAIEGKKLKVVLVKTGNMPLLLKNQPLFKIISDTTGFIFQKSNISSMNKGTTVIFIDKNSIVKYYDKNYGAQGEKLKPLEKVIKEELQILPDFKEIGNDTNTIKLGSIAPDFELGDGKKLSDYQGVKPVVISFYPAAFSGRLSDWGMADEPDKSEINQIEAITCAIQIKDISKIAVSLGSYEKSGKIGIGVTYNNNEVKTKDIKVLMLSSSEDVLLRLWEQTLGTTNIQYVNDKNYYISQKYNSYDKIKGYNYRTVFVVDKTGKFAYIDWKYSDEPDDNQRIKNVLIKLLE